MKEKIKIYNRSDTAIPLSVRVAGFDAEEETGEMIVGKAEDSIIDWFQFDKQNFVVDPGKKEEINFTVKIPEDAERRGYYAVIFLEADISTYIYNESKLQTIPGIGIPFMLKVGEEQTAEPLTILEYSISDANHLEKTEKALNFLTRPFIGKQNEIAVVKPGEPSFTVRLKNNSSYHTKLSGKIKLSGLGWKLKNELEFPPITILPGKTRRVLVKSESGENVPSAYLESSSNKQAVISIPSAMAAAGAGGNDTKTGFGLMKASLDLESSEEGIKKEENRWIFVFSWWLVFLLLAALVAVAAITIFLLRKRKPKKKLDENLFGDLFAREIKPEKSADKKYNLNKKQPGEKIKVKKIRKKPPEGKRKANNKKN